MYIYIYKYIYTHYSGHDIPLYNTGVNRRAWLSQTRRLNFCLRDGFEILLSCANTTIKCSCSLGRPILWSSRRSFSSQFSHYIIEEFVVRVDKWTSNESDCNVRIFPKSAIAAHHYSTYRNAAAPDEDEEGQWRRRRIIRSKIANFRPSIAQFLWELHRIRVHNDKRYFLLIKLFRSRFSERAQLLASHGVVLFKDRKNNKK